MPNACSREMLREVLNITGRRAFQQLLDYLSPLTKEVSPGRYVLFHARFAEYIRREYYPEICQISRTLIHNMEKYYDLIYPMSDVIDLFVRERNYSELLKWMGRRVRELEELNQDMVIEGTSRRYETIKALTYGFVLLHASDLKTYMRANDILDRFIASNFQVMVDWRFGEQLWNCLESTIKLEGLNKYLHVSLLYCSTMHARGQFDESVDLLYELKPCFDKSSRDFLRCVNYIGLNHGSLGELEKAIAAYTELLDTNSCDDMNVWTGYAMMNRGKLYQRQGKMDECLRDLLQATEVRERMVFDEAAFVSNRSDLADMVQAELTLAMGYENLAKAYRELTKSHADAGNVGEAKRYINKLAVFMDSLMERYPEETNNFGITGRLLLTLVEYFIDSGDYNQANHFYVYLKTCYVRIKDRSRLHTVEDKLNHG